MNIMPSDNHLRNSLATQGLATNKLLLHQGCKRIKHSRNEEEDGTSNQATRTFGKTDKLDTAKDGVNEGAHPVGCKAADEGIELRGCGTNSEEEGYFNEDDYECRDNAEATDDNQNQIERKDVRNSQRKAKDNTQHTRPLSIDAEISRSELLSQRHSGLAKIIWGGNKS